jgi:hypothetical protein
MHVIWFLLDISKEVYLKVNTEKAKNILVSAGQNQLVDS